MGMFYDPIKKRPQTWVFITFICVPILLVMIGFIWGKTKVKENSPQDKEVSPDEFFKTFTYNKTK